MSLVLPIPDRLPAPPPNLPPESFFWAAPGEGGKDASLFGLGAAFRVETEGPERFTRLAEAFTDLNSRWRRHDPEECGAEPVAFTALAFRETPPEADDPWNAFPNAVLVVPELLLMRREGNAFLILTGAAGDSREETAASWRTRLKMLERALEPPSPLSAGKSGLESLDRTPWNDRVNGALTAIREKRLQKAVPARRLRTAPARPGPVLAALSATYPDCVHFAAALADAVYAAATPERLLSLKERFVRAEAVGGTTNATSGDGWAGPKIQREHDLIARHVHAALAPLCDLDPLEKPEEIALRHLRHLRTAVTGRAAPGQGLFDLAAHLHPTPAVAGAPAAEALDWLKENDDPERGWYAGLGGWIDRAGDGELAVLIRGALFHAAGVDLYAGAGVVEGSDPAREFTETELKLRGILEALSP